MSSEKNISCKRELWKAIAMFLYDATGQKFSQKLVRDTYKQWANSTFSKTMSFGEFIKKAYI